MQPSFAIGIFVRIEPDANDWTLSDIFPELDHTDLVTAFLTVMLVFIAFDNDDVGKTVTEPVRDLSRAATIDPDIVFEEVFAKGFDKGGMDVVLFAFELSGDSASVRVEVVEAIGTH